MKELILTDGRAMEPVMLYLVREKPDWKIVYPPFMVWPSFGTRMVEGKAYSLDRGTDATETYIIYWWHWVKHLVIP